MSTSSCKRSSIYARQSFLNKPSISSTSPSETPSAKLSDLDARRKSFKSMLQSCSIDSKGKVLVSKRKSGLAKMTNLMETRHSIAIPPKNLFGETNDSIQNHSSERDSLETDRSDPLE